MGTVKVLLGAVLLNACLLIGGCAGSTTAASPNSAPGRNVQPGNGFPPPSTLHSASYTQQGLHIWGADYSASLPKNHVSPYHYGICHDAVFSPNADEGSHDPANMAYATYIFQLDGYNLEPALRFNWVTTGDFDDAWIALADFQRDRWVWYALPASGVLAFDPAKNISDTGEMYTVVLLAGRQQWQLRLLRVGPELSPPAVLLDATPIMENIPLAVNFSAARSFDPDGGSIAKYEWDWDGDGTYDADTGATPTATYTYTEVGSFPAVVRATDDEGDTSTATITIQPISYHCEPDTLYAIPLASHAAVGEPVRILVATGQLPYMFQFLSAVTVSFEQGGAYVADSFNIGAPGGERTDTDGYWALLGPPAPGNGNYLDIGDYHNPNKGSLSQEGLNYLSFCVVPQGSFESPTSIGQGTLLLNFELAFSTPGTYHLGFIQTIDTLDKTYYSDQNGHNHYWGVLDNSNTIVVE
jgi:PKD repeat protein